MTFTPDRKRRKSGKRDRRAAADSRGGASRRPPTNSNPMDSTAFPSPDARGSEDNTPVCPEGESSRPSSLAEQLKAAGSTSAATACRSVQCFDPVSTDDEETRTDTSLLTPKNHAKPSKQRTPQSPDPTPRRTRPHCWTIMNRPVQPHDPQPMTPRARPPPAPPSRLTSRLETTPGGRPRCTLFSPIPPGTTLPQTLPRSPTRSPH